MSGEREKIMRAKEILRAMADGVNPFSGEEIESGSFLHDPRMIRCLHFVQEVLTAALSGPAGAAASPESFSLTSEEKSRIELPEGKIGINAFAACVNQVIDPARSKKFSGVVINRQLKRMGILGEESTADGKKRTVLGSRSGEYGIESEKRNRDGQEYEMILFNERGKRFLRDNLERIMEFKE